MCDDVYVVWIKLLHTVSPVVSLDHLMADKGACVSECSEGHQVEDRKCVKCDGPCPKSVYTSDYAYMYWSCLSEKYAYFLIDFNCLLCPHLIDYIAIHLLTRISFTQLCCHGKGKQPASNIWSVCVCMCVRVSAWHACVIWTFIAPVIIDKCIIWWCSKFISKSSNHCQRSGCDELWNRLHCLWAWICIAVKQSY